jgi:hypothetical protein
VITAVLAGCYVPKRDRLTFLKISVADNIESGKVGEGSAVEFRGDENTPAVL